MSWYGFIQKYFGIFFAAGLALGLFFPRFFMPVTEHVMLILCTVMVMVFLTIDLQSASANIRKFHLVAAAVLISKVALPFLIYQLAKPLGETVSLAILLLCLTPFAAVSPTLTRILGGDTEFILLLQIITTLLAPFYMPFLLLLYAGAQIELDAVQMVKTLIYLIIIPFGISLVIRPLLGKLVKKTRKYYSALTILLIALLISGLITKASQPLLQDPLRTLPMAAIALALGVLLIFTGWFTFFFLDRKKRVGMAVSTLYMNIGLTAVLSAAFFTPEVMLFVLIYEIPANLLPGFIGRIRLFRPERTSGT